MRDTPDRRIDFTNTDVEAGVQSLIDNQYDEYDRADMAEIVQLVLGTATRGIREAAHCAGRNFAARAIVAHADEWAPAGGSVEQRRMRRHLLIAARVAAPKPTMEQIGAAIAAGSYAACYVPDGPRDEEEQH